MGDLSGDGDAIGKVAPWPREIAAALQADGKSVAIINARYCKPIDRDMIEKYGSERILVNSSAGLLGNLSSTKRYPAFAVVLAIAAVIGGTAGSYLGSRRFNHVVIKRLLAVVLLIAGVKLILTP